MLVFSVTPFEIVVFLASGQYTLSMRTYAPFRNVSVRIKDMTVARGKIQEIMTTIGKIESF